MATTKKTKAAEDLDTLLDKGKKVFVRNTTRPMGQIVLSFITNNGKSIPRPIPRTWIPICLTDSLAPDVVLQSNDLRLFLQKGVIQLVDPDEALKELQSSDAQEEQRRLNISDFSAAAEATDRVLEMQNQQTFAPAINNPMAPVQGVVADPVNNRVKATLLQVEAKDMTEREAVAEFRIMRGELSHHDLTYIISQSVEEGPLRRFAYQLLSELAATVDPNIIADDAPAEDPKAATKGREGQVIDD